MIAIRSATQTRLTFSISPLQNGQKSFRPRGCQHGGVIFIRRRKLTTNCTFSAAEPTFLAICSPIKTIIATSKVLTCNREKLLFRVKYLDLKAKSWHDVPRVPSVPEPPGRRSHACFVYNGKMWVVEFPASNHHSGSFSVGTTIVKWNIITTCGVSIQLLISGVRLTGKQETLGKRPNKRF